MTIEDEQVFINAYNSALDESKFRGYTKEAIKLGRLIMNLLGGNSSIFLEYERNVSLAEGIYLEKAYLLGAENKREKSRVV